MLFGFRLKIGLYVDCERKEAHFSMSVDGRIAPKTWNDPRWFEVDSPSKAETWFRGIDMDSIAERLWLEKRAAAAAA
ncbi:hypothetical protein NKI96_10630 [Mesorhizobium sp. M0292]|uniref:hypothetical protein n=1 Tax=Mesorhizobium sp. M0292 TaxID=2956929 RepID=UPI00333C9104